MADGDYPILLFPKPAYADRARRFGGGERPIRPGAREQGERLAPDFRRLQEAMENRRITIQESSLGIEPEMVLVLEVVGTVEEFFRAVEKVKGLEWLAEYELNDIEPGDGFQDARNPNKNLNGRLFLMMSDQRALTELQSLFDLWDRDSDKAKFGPGLARFKEVFKNLRKIRPWDVGDRLIDTGLLENWEQRKVFGQTTVSFEAELWYRSSSPQRQQAADQIRRLIKDLDGEIVTECVIQDIAYHAMLGQIKMVHVEEFLNRPEVRPDLALFQCDDVMFFRPVGQCAIPTEYETDEIASTQLSISGHRIVGAPVVALLDGMPLTRHKLLDGHLVMDDPDGYEDTYQAKERSHGTAMASLICHGDLNSQGEPLQKPIYIRPIMKPRRSFNDRFDEEAVPDDVLVVDLVHRAIVRMFRGEENEPPVSPGIRVVNLSIGDSARQFVREMSGWARLLDWLSHEYNLLFVVSAGNHTQPISLRTEEAGLRGLRLEEYQELVVSSVAEDTRNRRLLSPAETLNGVTVGAVHVDETGPGPNHLIDPVVVGMPSVISAHGPGYRRAIKPEIHLPGGRQLLSEEPVSQDGTTSVSPHFSGQSPGQCVATPGSVGALNATQHTRGTSNAAALATRQAYFFYELLEELRIQPEVEIPEDFDAVLMKSLLVHGAEWGEMYDSYKEFLGQSHDGRTFRDYVARFLGYGQPDFERVAMSTEERVTVLGFGLLLDGEAAEFALPLPPSLATFGPKMRLIVTLAWFSPINSRQQKYRVAHLWFDRPQGKIECNRLCADHRAVQRGTLQHEIFEGNSEVSIQEGDEMIIKINCRKDAGDILEPIRFGLTVTLEVTEDIPLYPISIYEEVRERLSVRVRDTVDAARV